MNIFSNMALVSWFYMIWLILLMYCLFFVQWQMYKSSCLLKSFRSLSRLPIIGSMYLIFGNMRTRMEKILEISKDLKEPKIFWVSYIPVILLGTSEHIMKASNRNQDRDTLGVFDSIFEDGILLARGEQWNYIRRIINQAFTTSMLKQYMRVFNEQSKIMVKRWREKADTGIHVDVHEYAINMNFDVITKNMLDYELKSQETGNNEFISAGVKCATLESKRYNNPILFFNLFFKIYLYLSGHIKSYKIIKELPKKLVKEKIREFKEKIKNDGTIEEKPAKTLMDIFFKEHIKEPNFNEHRMSIETLTMITSGSDTTATTISYICLLLAMHAEVQEKVYEEILNVFKDDFVTVTMEHCNELRYMEQCIKETLRRFTLIPATFRQCSEPIKFNDEQIIPAHCKVLFSYHSVHHDPSVYPNPDKFDPDRFSPENCAINAKNFMGFGVGHRACIGAKYAMLSLKTQLVHILRRYKLTTDMHMSDIIYILDVTSRSENGYPVQFWSRENEKML